LLYLSFLSLKRLGVLEVMGLTSQDGAVSKEYGSPTRLANLESDVIKESSGIAASSRNPGLYFTHNDSGAGPFVFVFDRQGKHHGVWRVEGAQARDWEDMAIGPGPARGESYIYLGDIGDNERRRDEIVIYRVREPVIGSESLSSTIQSPRKTEPADLIRVRYPDGKHNAETLLVHPVTGDLYIVTKVRGASARVYKLAAPAPKSGVATLAFIGEFRFPNMFVGFITGGGISPDGRRVVLCDYLGACELILPDNPGAAFDEIWKQPPATVDLGSRKQGEAVCYRADGLALLATSEGVPCPLIEVVRRDRAN
jgi:hypothetical protein